MVTPTTDPKSMRVLLLGQAGSYADALRAAGLVPIVVPSASMIESAAGTDSPAAAVGLIGPDGEHVGALTALRLLHPLTQTVVVTRGAPISVIARAVNEAGAVRVVEEDEGPSAVVAAVLGAATRHDELVAAGRTAEVSARQAAELRELAQSLEEKVNERTELLIRAKRTWEQTFDAISDPLSIVDPERRIVRTNLAWAGAAQQDIRRVNGRTCHEALFGADERCPGCPLERTLATGQMGTVEVRPAVGGRTWRVVTFPMHSRGDHDRAPDRAVCHYRDVTEEKGIQRVLLQTEKMAAVGQLAGGIAHEINNPLGAILAFAQLALRDVDPESETCEFLQEIEEGALRCRDIVQNLLTFSRPSRPDDVTQMDLNGVVDRAAALLAHEFADARWHLVLHCAPGLPPAWGNRNRMQQVVMNLLTNAKAATPAGGAVTIETSLDDAGRLAITVSDTGTGIADEVLPHIFEPFFTTKDEGKGTGLGLALSYGIVKEHGGTIEVDTAPGAGTTFRVVLPRAAQERRFAIHAEC